MSWWDSKGFSNLASQAFKTAQSKIDKVLDIQGEEGAAGSGTSQPPSSCTSTTSGSSLTSAVAADGTDEWSNWMASDTLGFGSESSPFSGGSSTKSSTSLSAKKNSPRTSLKEKKENMSSASSSSRLLLKKKSESTEKKKEPLSSSSTESFASSKSSEKFASKEETITVDDFASVGLTAVTTTDPVKEAAPTTLTEKTRQLSGGNSAKKGKPLKLGTNKQKSKDEHSEGKSKKELEMEEMLKREKEAEEQLLLLLGGAGAPEKKTDTKSTPQSAATKTVKKEEKTAAAAEPARLDVEVTQKSLLSMDMGVMAVSTSSVDSAQWGDAGLLTESQIQAGDSAVLTESQVCLENWGEEDILTESQIMHVTEHVQQSETTARSESGESPEIDTDKTLQIESVETPEQVGESGSNEEIMHVSEHLQSESETTVNNESGESPEIKSVETQEQVGKYGGNEEIVTKTDENESHVGSNKDVVTIDTETQEVILKQEEEVEDLNSGKEKCVTDNRDQEVEVESIEHDISISLMKVSCDDVIEPQAEHVNKPEESDISKASLPDKLLDSLEPKNSDSVMSGHDSVVSISTLDGSLTSSENVDDLSSSNQTLTADDLQSSVNSNKSSDKDIDAEVAETDHPVTRDQPDASLSDHQTTSQLAEQSDAAAESSGALDIQDLPTVHHHVAAETEEAEEAEDGGGGGRKERASTMESVQSAGSGKSSEGTAPMTTSQSSSSSLNVKHMLEEAMVESIKDLDSRSDSVSHDSSSDMVRIESDQNSGHTSGDDLETAASSITSSDIEIISHISTPTPNGENRGFVAFGVDRPFDLSPLRQALNKAVRRNSPPSHKRSDSGSSAYSLQSKNGDEVTSPGEHPSHTVRHRDEANNDPYEKEKLLKEPTPSENQLQPICESTEQNTPNLDADKILEKLAEKAELLEAREKKLVDLSRQNMDLLESNNILKNQLDQSEEAREAEMTDLNELTDEFTKRLSDSEKRLSMAAKECEGLKKKLQETELQLVKRSDSSSSAERLLKEKDQQIAELLAEGEKLSKQQLQSNNILKKLRTKEKENEGLLKAQKEKIEGQKTEVERLQKVLDNKCDVEKKQNESINQLQSLIKRQEKELEKYKTEWEEAGEKVRSLQSALDTSYKEIAELHKAKVTKATEKQEAKLSCEIQAKQDLQMQLDRYNLKTRQEQEALVFQIEDLRMSMSRLEKENGRREDVLRQEISDLQQRLQEAEKRNQELTTSVSAATRPLLRQIENIQSTYTQQSNSYDKIEKNLTDRLSEGQMQLATAQEKERVAKEQLLDNESRLTTLESQISTLRQDKSRLQARLEMEKTKVEVMEDAKNNEAAQREALQHSLEGKLSELKKEKLLLENQLEMEKMRVEAEKKKLQLAHEQIRDKELQLSQVKTISRSSTPSESFHDNSMINSMNQSMTNSFLSQTGDDLERSFVFTPAKSASASTLALTSPGAGLSLYESMRTSGAASFMENLQSQLKMKDGEIAQLQDEILELSRTRESMARELVNLTNNNTELEDKSKELPEMQEKYRDLHKRYQAILQMYGEKTEEAQELRLDLQDVKDMYKLQIDQLLQKC